MYETQLAPKIAIIPMFWRLVVPLFLTEVILQRPKTHYVLQFLTKPLSTDTCVLFMLRRLAKRSLEVLPYPLNISMAHKTITFMELKREVADRNILVLFSI